MTTQPTNLPFIPDPNYDYILTDDDRQKFAPLQVTDETWIDGGWVETFNTPAMGFGIYTRYRRRKPALPQPPKPAAEVAFGDYRAANLTHLHEQEKINHFTTWLAAIAWAKDHKEAL